jgi:hypothetical protein
MQMDRITSLKKMSFEITSCVISDIKSETLQNT